MDNQEDVQVLDKPRYKEETEIRKLVVETTINMLR